MRHAPSPLRGSAAIRAAITVCAACLAIGCGGKTSTPSTGHYAASADSGIVWDARTLRRPLDGPASYPRLIRLRGGALLLSLESDGASLVLRSDDDGASWSAPVVVAAAHDGIAAAVPSLLELRSGVVLLAYNARPPRDNADPAKRFAIRLAGSADGGRTWADRATVFTAGYQWGRGVWEPAMTELPSGELLCFVANEYPYANDDQEISVLRSLDEGLTWSAPACVSHRVGHRDGMPVPLPLPDGGGIALAIEDNGLAGSAFKPAIVRLPSDAAISPPVSGGSALRSSALSPDAQLPRGAYGGAPYLARFPDGATVLSFQSNAGRDGGWSDSTMVVAVGDAQASGFGRVSFPFDVPDGRHALWGSLFVHDADTVTALTTTDAYSGSVQELYLIDGHRVVAPAALAVVSARDVRP